MYHPMFRRSRRRKSVTVSSKPATNSSPTNGASFQPDYATWHARLKGSTSNATDAASRPAAAFVLDYATWHRRLQSDNAAAASRHVASPVILLEQPAEIVQLEREAA
jgi:hypothetical protein